MGTRNSTMVKLDGNLKVAQYGQWDGYPTGQGETIANFLRKIMQNKTNLEVFKTRLNNLKEVDLEEQKAFLKEIGAEDGWLNMEQSAKHNKRFPGLNRDHGAGILELIYNGEVTEIHLEPDFKEDTLFCEYWYEINLDDETVTMNGKKYSFEEWTQDGFMEKLEKEEREEDE